MLQRWSDYSIPAPEERPARAALPSRPAACQAALGLHGLAQSSEPGVRVNVGVVRAGTSLNIVPDQALLEFEIRAAEMPVLESLDRRCRTMVEMTAAAHEVNSTISLRGAAESWRNPAAVVSWAARVNSAVSAFGNCLLDHSFGASEDATVLANEVVRHGGAAGNFVLGSDLSDGHHTPHFDFDESVLSRGVLFASAAIGAALAIELIRLNGYSGDSHRRAARHRNFCSVRRQGFETSGNLI